MADSASLQARSFGKIAVPAPGTPVRLTADTTLRVSRLRFAPVIGEVGRVFLGVAEGLTGLYWKPEWAPALSVIAMLLILVVWPKGLGRSA